MVDTGIWLLGGLPRDHTHTPLSPEAVEDDGGIDKRADEDQFNDNVDD